MDEAGGSHVTCAPDATPAGNTPFMLAAMAGNATTLKVLETIFGLDVRTAIVVRRAARAFGELAAPTPSLDPRLAHRRLTWPERHRCSWR